MGKIAAHSAYDMFSWYKYLIVNLVFSHLGFWSGNLFLIASFPDLCVLVFIHHIGFLKKSFAWKAIGISFSCQNLDLSLSFLVCPNMTCKNRTLPSSVNRSCL